MVHRPARINRSRNAIRVVRAPRASLREPTRPGATSDQPRHGRGPPTISKYPSMAALSGRPFHGAGLPASRQAPQRRTRTRPRRRPIIPPFRTDPSWAFLRSRPFVSSSSMTPLSSAPLLDLLLRRDAVGASAGFGAGFLREGRGLRGGAGRLLLLALWARLGVCYCRGRACPRQQAVPGAAGRNAVASAATRGMRAASQLLFAGRPSASCNGPSRSNRVEQGACTVVKVSKRPLLIPGCSARPQWPSKSLRFLVSYCASQPQNRDNRSIGRCPVWPPPVHKLGPSQNQSGRKDAASARGAKPKAPKERGCPMPATTITTTT